MVQFFVKMLRILRPSLRANAAAARQLSCSSTPLNAIARPSCAVVGVGFFAENHLNAWNQLDVKIGAIADIDAGRLETVGEMFGVPKDRQYTDPAALMADKEKLGIDFVDIVTQVQSHEPLVTMAAEHELSVICQKPFAESVAQGERIVAVCADAGVELMVHENWRFQSVFQEVLTAITDGKLGDPFFCQLSFRTPYNVYANQPYLAEQPRFIIEDLGIHLLDCARAIMGEATSVAARIHRINPAIQGEDVATIMLGHENGGTSVIDCSYKSSQAPDPFPETLVRVDGDVGSIVVCYDYTIKLFKKDVLVEEWRAPPAEHEWSKGSEAEAILDSVFQIQKHWLACWEAGQWPAATSGVDNVETLKLVDASYLSAEENRLVNPQKM